MKDKNIILLIVCLSLFGSFFLAYGDELAVVGKSIFDGWATQATTSVSLSIQCFASVDIGESGNATFEDTACLEAFMPAITNLTSGWQVNVSLRGRGYPSGWNEAQPNSTQAGSTKLEYFEVVINETAVPNSSYRIFFNLTQAALGDTPPENMSLFMYNDTSTSWLNLTTEVINGTNDPAQFFGVAPHFSKFLVAEKVSAAGVEEEAEPPAEAAGGGGGGGAGIRVITAVEKEEVEEEELPPEPVHISGDYFDVTLFIPKKYRELFAGEELIAELSIINIKRIGVIGVEVEYTIEDRDGKVLWSWIEQKSVENEITFIRSVDLPLELTPGYYMFFARVRFEDDIAVSGYPFKVIAPERIPSPFQQWFNYSYAVLFFVLGILVLVVTLFMLRKLSRKMSTYEAYTVLKGKRRQLLSGKAGRSGGAYAGTGLPGKAVPGQEASQQSKLQAPGKQKKVQAKQKQYAFGSASKKDYWPEMRQVVKEQSLKKQSRKKSLKKR